MGFSKRLGYDKDHMLYNMQGALFVAIAEVLRIKLCKNRCLAHLRYRKFDSIKDLAFKFGSKVTAHEQDAVRDKLLMCCYFFEQNIISDWSVFARNMTEGTMYAEMQEFFDDWLENNYPRANTLHRALVVALRSKPSLTSAQAAFCFNSLPDLVVCEMNILLHLLLLRSCASVYIRDAAMVGRKMLILQFTEDHSEQVLFLT
jgi:hypothetical protein